MRMRKITALTFTALALQACGGNGAGDQLEWTVLTAKPDTYQNPTYSPDGSKLAWQAGSGEGSGVFVAGSDGSGVKRVSAPEDRYYREFAWSPDGSKIAYSSSRSGPPCIYIAPVDGGDIQQLTNAPSVEGFPRWSPDGSRIMYLGIASGNADVMMIPAQGGTPSVQLATPADELGFWSPDGSRIGYQNSKGSRRWI